MNFITWPSLQTISTWWHGLGLRPSLCVQTEAALVHMEEEELRRTSSEWDLHTQSVSNTLQEEEISRSCLCLEYNGTLTPWFAEQDLQRAGWKTRVRWASHITFMHGPNSLFHIQIQDLKYYFCKGVARDISECFCCLHACSFWYS